MTVTLAKHPAKFSPSILKVLAEELEGITGELIDVFAGTGKIHELARPDLTTWGVELEEEWARYHERTIIGNSLHLPFEDKTFDAAATSPCYANRMADHHIARENSKRNTYTHTLGRQLSPENAGAMQWGHEYRHLHLGVWIEQFRVLKPKAKVLMNISNHIRKGEEIDVTGWHKRAMEAIGYEYMYVRTVETQRFREGENADLRCAHESVLVFRRPR